MRLLLPCVAVLAGCSIAPKGVEATVVLGPQTVEVTARLSDFRVGDADVLEALRALSSIATPEQAALTVEGRVWWSRVERYTWILKDQQLDLEVVAQAPRAAFEACAAQACGRAQHPEKGCAFFPLQRCGDALTVIDAAELTYPEGSALRWPGSATTLQFRAQVKTNLSHAPLEAFRRWRDEPQSAKAAVAWVEQYQAAFAKGELKTRSTLEAAIDDQPEDFGRLLREKSVRERLTYLYAVLPEQHLLLPPPPDCCRLGVKFEALQPASPLPEAPRLRLQLLYQVALASLSDGQRARMLEDEFWSVCEDRRMKSADGRRVCTQLMGRASRWAR